MSEDNVARLTKAAHELVECISFDENGRLIGGVWMGGNGGLLSRDTHAKADEVRRILDAFKKEPRP